MEQGEKKIRGMSKIWVPIVLAVGVIVGLALSAVQSTMATPWRPPGHGHGGISLRFDTADDIDIVLSTVSVFLLLALVIVYSKTFRETKAQFSLVLVFVFLALLFQSVLTSPLVYGAFGQDSGGLGSFLLLADIFKIAAFTVFLYLSLD